jgi:methyl-accepting chemotaxis protein
MALMKTSALASRRLSPQPAKLEPPPASVVTVKPALSQRRVKERLQARQEKAAERIGAATEQLASGVAEASAAAEELRRALEQIASAAEEAAGAAQESHVAVHSLGSVFA